MTIKVPDPTYSFKTVALRSVSSGCGCFVLRAAALGTTTVMCYHTSEVSKGGWASRVLLDYVGTGMFS